MLCCNLFIECDFILDFVLLSKIKLLRVARYSGAVAVPAMSLQHFSHENFN